jgi:mevalonate kinase
MPAISASAPGKIILLGEHAVVYGQPAIALPVTKVQAKAIVTANPRGAPGVIHIQAPAIGLEADINDLPPEDPFKIAVGGTLAALGIQRPPACTLRVTSTIPVASGLGSGAAVAVAAIRGLSTFLGHPLTNEQTSWLAFEVEKIHHGTPSGIDNAVVTYGKPIYFVRGKPFELLHVPVPFTLVIASTGIASPTAITVGDVRRLWEADPVHWEQLFNDIGEISRKGRTLIETGEPYRLGELLSANHALLQELGVSSVELDHLVGCARQSGALGAKLSGGGRGGNMIALVKSENAAEVATALQGAGATQIIITSISG